MPHKAVSHLIYQPVLGHTSSEGSFIPGPISGAVCNVSEMGCRQGLIQPNPGVRQASLISSGIVALRALIDPGEREQRIPQIGSTHKDTSVPYQT